MSSILKALKKLEEESALQKDQIESESQPIEQKIMIHKYLLILAAFFLLGIVGWLIIYTTGKPGLEKKQGISSLELPASSLSSQPPAPASLQTFKGEKPVQPAAANTLNAHNTLDGETRTGQGREDNDNREISPKEVKNTQHTGLILTGVLWSQVKERRLALINDLYLKEGDHINGISVIRIEKNEVTLQSGPKTWTIGLKK